ncbi:nodulation protein NfeD [bacterium]|nr:nodulation protein NfeD [bacterium]
MRKILRAVFRWCYLLSIFLGLTLPVVGEVLAAPRSQDESPIVYVLSFSGAVTPVLHEYLYDGIEAAQASGAAAVVLQLDTPGGSVEVTKRIVQAMLGSPVPIVVYVSPSAAQAGSAGTFITLAGHVAAMAPGSSIGAASPVGAGGEDVGETMEAKVTNILAADIENLAARRGEEAVAWAIAAVEEAAAATANRALELGVIDIIATDIDDLLTQLDGFTVTVLDEPVTLATADALIRPLEMNGFQQFLNFITNPSVATILLTLGSIGLIAEIYNPGTFVPGTVGLISLLLGLYALGQLDANFAGIALIVLAVILFVAEAVTPTFGALATGGIAAFIFGSMLLFDAPGLSVPWPLIITLSVGMAAFTVFVGGKALSIQRRQPRTGSEAMIGKSAQVRTAFDAEGHGKVLHAGELWNAELPNSESGQPKPVLGDTVVIEAVKGYTLVVRYTK